MTTSRPAATPPGAHLPGRIPWDPPAADGTRSATVHGRRLPGEQFSYAFAVPGGVWDAPHSHPVDAHVVVTSGTLLLGYGHVHDRAAAHAYPAGSYLFVPAGAVHFDGADQDTVIIGVATGPWSTDYDRADVPPRSARASR